MSPMPRVGRTVPALLLFCLVVLTALLAAVGAPAAAQEGGGEAGDNDTVPRKLTVRALDDGCAGEAPCWDLETLVVTPGDTVELTVDMSPSAQAHNLFVAEPIEQAVPETGYTTGEVLVMTFQVPEDMSEPITYVCQLHETTMVGEFVTPAILAAGQAAHEDIPELGVHFLAYWVGVIAFALLFIVYGATFFLFKYNETPATTDHWDRSGEGKGRFSSGVATLLAVVIGVVALAAVIFLASG